MFFLRHFDLIGKRAAGNHITDVLMADGQAAYGPVKVRQLSHAEQLINADNYRWFAQEQFWHVQCVKDFSPARDERDTEEPQCLPGRCTLQ